MSKLHVTFNHHQVVMKSPIDLPSNFQPFDHCKWHTITLEIVYHSACHESIKERTPIVFQTFEFIHVLNKLSYLIEILHLFRNGSTAYVYIHTQIDNFLNFKIF